MYFFSKRRKYFPINKEDYKHEKNYVTDPLLHTVAFIYICIQNKLPREVVGNYFKIRFSKVLFLVSQFVTSSLLFSKTQQDHTHCQASVRHL